MIKLDKIEYLWLSHSQHMGYSFCRLRVPAIFKYLIVGGQITVKLGKLITLLLYLYKKAKKDFKVFENNYFDTNRVGIKNLNLNISKKL